MTTYWHGGPVGRAVGDFLLPAEALGKPNGDDEYARIAGLPNDGRLNPRVARRDRVYVTTEFWNALHFASVACDLLLRKRMPGAVYEVEPEGRLVADPDCPYGISFECLRAKVVAIVIPSKRQLREARKRAVREQRKYTFRPPEPKRTRIVLKQHGTSLVQE